MDKLFWQLFNATGEDEVTQLISNNELLRDCNNWYPYGGNSKDDKSNFSTFDNQQPNPIPALVEKITNSIDALLLKECKLRNIDPKSKTAPRTMGEAVEIFYGIKNGDFSEVDKKTVRHNIAEKIQIIATGDHHCPDILIYDDGEGQHPDDFKDTFLSLGKNNKTSIHFVQGKYNMGSTGAVIFCGKQRYQLIGSKQPDILNNRKDKYFGFTLIRRHPLTEEQENEYGSSWYEYFYPNNKISRFEINDLELGLWKKKFATGSIIKLYKYQLPRGSRSSIERDLWRDLNQYLYQPALPFIVYDKRYKDNKSPTTPVWGNKTRIIVDDREKKEKTIFESFVTKEIGNVNIEATIFKHDVPQNEFIRSKPVIFTVNGQVHGSLTRSYISQNIGFPLLRDSLLIHIDCTNLRTSFRQDLFKANRYSLNEGEAYNTLMDKITEVLKANEDLKTINQERKNTILHDNKDDRESLKIILESIPLDKEILDILNKNGDLNIFKNYKKELNREKKIDGENKVHISKRFPSIFKIDLKENNEGKRVKSIPINGKGIISFETNVEDEYLFRPKERGELQIQVLGVKNNDVTGGTDKGKPNKVEDMFDVTKSGPTNNTIRVTFNPKENLNVGDEIEVNVKLTSPESDLESIFYIKIVNPQKEATKEKEKINDSPAMPQPIKVFENDERYNSWSWTGEDVVKIIPSDEGKNIIEAIAVNMDSYAIKRFISKNKVNTEQGLTFIKDKYFASIYLHSLFLYGILGKSKEAEGYQTGFDIEDMVPNLFKTYGALLLYSNTNNYILDNLKND